MTASPHSERREQALETAAGIFLRYGYRKTSMDDIAQAVGLSRQGLYLWFPNKKALFSDMLDHLMATTKTGVVAALKDDGRPLVDRVVAAFDVYAGAFVAAGVNATAMDELLETSVRVVGDRVAEFEDDFRGLLAEVLAPVGDDDLSAADLADLLYAVSAGLKYRVDGRDAYRLGVRKAAQLVASRGRQ